MRLARRVRHFVVGFSEFAVESYTKSIRRPNGVTGCVKRGGTVALHLIPPGITVTTLMTMTHHQTQHHRSDHARKQQPQPRLLSQSLAVGGVVHPLVGVLMRAVGVRVGEGGDDGGDVEEGAALWTRGKRVRWVSR